MAISQVSGLRYRIVTAGPETSGPAGNAGGPVAAVRLFGRYTTSLVARLPISRLMMNSTRNTKNSTLAITYDGPATSVKPNSPAISAITRNTRAQRSMAHLLQAGAGGPGAVIWTYRNRRFRRRAKGRRSIGELRRRRIR